METINETQVNQNQIGLSVDSSYIPDEILENMAIDNGQGYEISLVTPYGLSIRFDDHVLIQEFINLVLLQVSENLRKENF
jgi:hypothetical protein